tara:strand:+ start:310 stop:732 length:423 start_codon:yes stop_codon:yes gene_type:complete
VIRLATKDEMKHIKNDPVRPHIKKDWRTRCGREVYVLERDNSIDAVICVAYMDEVPINEDDMKWVGMNHAVFYTVWSYKKGAGREIVNGVSKKIKAQKPWVKRFVTLSPLTEMARKFHISNGAKFIGKGDTCQNFEYEIC